MSHIATVEVQFKDIETLKKACQRIGVKTEEVKNYKFYDGTVKSGTAVYLDGWRYPAVVTAEGDIFFDNYNGNWGKIEELNTLKQYYGVERSKKLARAKGYTFKETKTKTGLPQVIIEM